MKKLKDYIVGYESSIWFYQGGSRGGKEKIKTYNFAYNDESTFSHDKVAFMNGKRLLADIYTRTDELIPRDKVVGAVL